MRRSPTLSAAKTHRASANPATTSSILSRVDVRAESPRGEAYTLTSLSRTNVFTVSPLTPSPAIAAAVAGELKTFM